MMKSLFPRDYKGLFEISRARPNGDGSILELDGLHVLTMAPMRALPVFDASGNKVGALLGWPVDYRNRHVIDDALHLNASLGTDIDAFVEAHIYALGGTFLFVFSHGGVARIYLDAGGSQSLVYDPETGRAAAISPQLVSPEDADARLDAELYSHLRVDRDGWFPAGLTAHRGIRRLLPNFYLDMDSMNPVRHWPDRPLVETDDPETACRRIAACVRETMDACLDVGTGYVGLTAGNETRILMACARDRLDRVAFMTVDAKPRGIDQIRAAEIADRFDLDHRFLALVYAQEDAVENWRARAGQAIGGSHPLTHPTTRPLADRRWLFGGAAGEVGRCFFWRPNDTADMTLTAGSITARLGMPVHPRVVAEVETWLATCAGMDAFTILDLAYLELRVGGWGFAHAYVRPDPIDIHPLICRDVFAAMMQLPVSWRKMENRTNMMMTRIIAEGWPELLEIPINQFGDYRDRLAYLKRAVRSPYLVMKRLRKRFF